MKNNKNSTWTIVFWIVTIICILQYLFIALPRLTETPNVTGAYYFGSLLPNSVIIFIFWLIKTKAKK
ncbi:hypothetical protein ETU10_08730 [Apibacter muscae]|uniref:hypothetical protein n=1 Tax=Apibacter muscae TaxID=2509004 RepID=UPI0011AC47B9|nr:hypothetical protein [Apibacter muscae]TWP23170.1 hypothetical protein ETU10_08730 [Apibacter muscae]